MINETDRKILEILEIEGRITFSELARRLGSSGPSIHVRVRKLEETGIIRGYTVRIDPVAVERTIVAFIRVTTRPFVDRAEQRTFETAILEDTRVIDCHDIDGEDSYLLKASCRSLLALRSLVRDVRCLPAV